MIRRNDQIPNDLFYINMSKVFSVTTNVYKNYGYGNIQGLQNLSVQSATALSFVRNAGQITQQCLLDVQLNGEGKYLNNYSKTINVINYTQTKIGSSAVLWGG